MKQTFKTKILKKCEIAGWGVAESWEQRILSLLSRWIAFQTGLLSLVMDSLIDMDIFLRLSSCFSWLFSCLCLQLSVCRFAMVVVVFVFFLSISFIVVFLVMSFGLHLPQGSCQFIYFVALLDSCRLIAFFFFLKIFFQNVDLKLHNESFVPSYKLEEIKINKWNKKKKKESVYSHR